MDAMKNRSESQMMACYQLIVNRMKKAGMTIKKHILDNEASAAYTALIKENGIVWEFVPPGQHRRNIAERAIQTSKDHFVAILVGVSTNFSMHLWCRLLPQAEFTLNLLRQSINTPNVSSNAHVHGTHKFMKRPLETLVCDIQAQEKAYKRRTWDPHSCDGWNVGTSMDHHRCFKVWIKNTSAERDTDTIFLNTNT